jgi:GR25 family glycosyltransferase involved in LPS biosynthesis
MDSAELVKILLESDQYRETVLDRESRVASEYSVFDYCVITVDDRAAENVNKIKSTLDGYRFHAMEYFKSTADNYQQFYQNRNININWKPEHSFNREEPLLGEFGICGSQILALEYMVENNIPEMIVFEDDVQLTDKFLDYLNLAYKDLPDDYDFLADSTVFPNQRFFDHHPTPFMIESDYICRSDLQNAHLGFMLYSLKGAKKILALLKEDGFFAPIDTMLFYQSRHRKLEGYTTFFFNRLISDKDFYGSMIDTDNIRR